MSVVRSVLGALLESAGEELAELIGGTEVLRKNLQADPTVDDSASAAAEKRAAAEMGEAAEGEGTDGEG